MYSVPKSVSKMERIPNSPKSYNNSLNQQRSLILFHSAIKSPKTKQQYQTYLNDFLKYFLIKSHDKLIQIESKKLQEMIEDYVIYHKNKGCSASLIAGKLAALKLFFSMNDILVNWDKVRKMLPEKKKLTGDRAYSNEEIQILLKNTINLEYRSLINFMSASGVRVGCFEELKINDLEDMPNGCKSVRVYGDTIHEYYTFIHAEAVRSLDDYLESRKRGGEILTSDSWVFCSPLDTSKPLPADTITSTMGRYVKKTLGREKAQSGRYKIMSCHGLRKRFDTILKSNKDVNLSLAERLMGHSQTIPLDNSYFKPVIEQLFEEYQKVISTLVIDDRYRMIEELKNKDKKIHELESDKDMRITMLESHVLELANRLNSRS